MKKEEVADPINVPWLHEKGNTRASLGAFSPKRCLSRAILAIKWRQTRHRFARLLTLLAGQGACGWPDWTRAEG